MFLMCLRCKAWVHETQSGEVRFSFSFSVCLRSFWEKCLFESKFQTDFDWVALRCQHLEGSLFGYSTGVWWMNDRPIISLDRFQEGIWYWIQTKVAVQTRSSAKMVKSLLASRRIQTEENDPTFHCLSREIASFSKTSDSFTSKLFQF